MCKCKSCDLEIKNGLTYCSKQCQQDYQRMVKVNLWLDGKNGRPRSQYYRGL